MWLSSLCREPTMGLQLAATSEKQPREQLSVPATCCFFLWCIPYTILKAFTPRAELRWGLLGRWPGQGWHFLRKLLALHALPQQGRRSDGGCGVTATPVQIPQADGGIQLLWALWLHIFHAFSEFPTRATFTKISDKPTPNLQGNEALWIFLGWGMFTIQHGEVSLGSNHGWEKATLV